MNTEAHVYRLPLIYLLHLCACLTVTCFVFVATFLLVANGLSVT